MSNNNGNTVNLQTEKENIKTQNDKQKIKPMPVEPSCSIELDSSLSTHPQFLLEHSYYVIQSQQQNTKQFDIQKQLKLQNQIQNNKQTDLAQQRYLKSELVGSSFDYYMIKKWLIDQRKSIQQKQTNLKQQFLESLKIAQKINRKVKLWIQTKDCISFVYSNGNFYSNQNNNNSAGINVQSNGNNNEMNKINNKMYIIGEINRFKYQILSRQTDKNRQLNLQKNTQQNYSNLQQRQMMNKLQIFYQYLTSVYPFTLSSLSSFTPITATTTAKNQVQIPVYSIEQKKWDYQSFRIRNLQFINQNYKLLTNFRQSTFNLNPSINSTKRYTSQKSYIFFPHQLSSMAFCYDKQNPSILYLYGGINHQVMECSNTLYKMDFQLKTIEILQQKGEYPEARQNAFLFQYNTLFLILYGGHNFNQCSVFNDFYIYSIANQTWYNISGDFQYLVNARINSSLVFAPCNQTLYLFGGMLYDYQNKPKLLNDMYQFKFIDVQIGFKRTKDGKRQKGKVQVRSIFKKNGCQWPAQRMGQKLVYLNESYILMIGGQTNVSSQNHFQYSKQFQFNSSNQISQEYQNFSHKNVWLFNMKDKQWVEIFCWNENYFAKGRHNFSLSILPNKIKSLQNGQYELVIFGGNKDNAIDGFNAQNNNTLIKMFLSTKFTRNNLMDEENIKQDESKKIKTCSNCQLCQRKQLLKNAQISSQLQYQTPAFSCDQIDSFLLSSISHPFQAIGMLSAIASQKQSSKFTIQYKNYINTQNYNQNYLHIQDDGCIAYTYEQIRKHMQKFVIHDQMEIMGVNDKKYKILHSRQRNVIQFCNQLKIAALRLGQEFFWMGYNSSQLIVMMVRKQRIELPSLVNVKQKINLQSSNSQFVYRTYLYGCCSRAGKILYPYNVEIKKKVQKHYGLTIKQFIKQKRYGGYGSLLKIFSLRHKSVQLNGKTKIYHELNPIVYKNTIKLSQQFHKNRSFVYPQQLRYQESIDSDLRVYLSMFNIHRVLKMSLRVKYGYKKHNTSFNAYAHAATLPFSDLKLYKSLQQQQNDGIDTTKKNNNSNIIQQNKNNIQTVNIIQQNQSININHQQKKPNQQIKKIILEQKIISQGQIPNKTENQDNIQQNINEISGSNPIISKNLQQLNKFLQLNHPHLFGQPKIVKLNKKIDIIDLDNSQQQDQKYEEINKNQEIETLIINNKQGQKAIQKQKVDKMQIQESVNNNIQTQRQNAENIRQHQNQQDKNTSRQAVSAEGQTNQNNRIQEQKAATYIHLKQHPISQQNIQIQQQTNKQSIQQTQKLDFGRLQQQIKSIIKDSLTQPLQTRLTPQHLSKPINLAAKTTITQKPKPKMISEQQNHRQQVLYEYKKRLNQQKMRHNNCNNRKGFSNKNNDQGSDLQDDNQLLMNSGNKLEDIMPHFTLVGKIDSLVKKGKIYQIDGEVLSDFDLKTVELYYWKRGNTQNQAENKQTKTSPINLQNPSNSKIQPQKFTSLNSNKNNQYQQMTYPNGLLIYHKNRLIKRYKYGLGMNFQHKSFFYRNEIQKNKFKQISSKNMEPFYRAATTYTFNFFGSIQISQKFTQNIFGNGFLNEYLLQKLYEKIQQVAMWCQIKWGIWSDIKSQGVEQLKYRQIDSSKRQRQNSVQQLQEQQTKKKIKPNEE